MNAWRECLCCVCVVSERASESARGVCLRVCVSVCCLFNQPIFFLFDEFVFHPCLRCYNFYLCWSIMNNRKLNL